MNAKQIASKLKEANKIIIFHHLLPDGDSLSSSYALLVAMKNKFPEKTIKWVADKEFINKRFPYLGIKFDDVISGEEVDKTWTSLIGDNAVLERIYGSEIYMKAGTKLCFDHHRNNINFAADVYWQESDLGASSIQAFYIARELEVEYSSKDAILALYGILTDTGNFQFSLADPRPLEAAAELMKFIKNDDLDKVYQAMQVKTPKDIAIQAYVLGNYVLEKGVAYVKWDKEIQDKLNIDANDCARVNLIANIEGSGAWIFFIEYPEDKKIRVEFRSLGLPVNKVAIKFGGGGHIRASGASIDVDWNKADEIVKTTQEALKVFKEKRNNETIT